MLTIVIPYYNNLDGLNLTLKSIDNQRNKNFEVIIIDDGSLVRLNSNALNFQHHHHIYHKKNGGVSSARNLGLSKVKTKWVCFLDSGDYVEKCFVEQFYEVIKTNETNFIGFSFIQIKSEKIESSKSKHGSIQNLTYDNYLKQLVNFKQLFCICSCFFNTEKAKILGGFLLNATHGEDHEFIIRYFKKENKCLFIDNDTFFYIQDDINSATRKVQPLDLFAHTIYLLHQAELNANEKKYLAYTAFVNLIINIRNHFYKKSIQNFCKLNRFEYKLLVFSFLIIRIFKNGKE